MTSRWLSPSILAWHASIEIAARTDVDRWTRPHQLLAHAEHRLEQATDEFSLADAVLNLKRSVNSRLKHLDELYGLAAAFPRSVGVLERLQTVDLARPLLIRQMFELRNDIEHNDVPVPDTQRCRALADATWYFLRATDSPCSASPRDLTFCPANIRPMQAGSPFVSFSDLTPGLPAVTVVARVHHGEISAVKLDGYLEIEDAPDFRDSLRAVRARSNLPSDDIGEQTYGRLDNQVQFGKLRMDDGARHLIWSKLFGSVRMNAAQLIIE